MIDAFAHILSKSAKAVFGYSLMNLFHKYNVKKGLRNDDGTGVRVGLTRIADVVGYKYVDEVKTDDDREVILSWYRASRYYPWQNISKNQVCGYEETCFLLLFGYLA